MRSSTFGDTLAFSVKQQAYEHLGPVDEVVNSATASIAAQAAARLAPLRRDPQVDGVLSVMSAEAAAATGRGTLARAVPDAALVGADLNAAAGFGSAGDPSGRTGPAPGPGAVVINTNLATLLGARPGSLITFYPYGRPVPLRVARVVATYGLAGYGATGAGGSAFVSTSVLARRPARHIRPHRSWPRWCRTGAAWNPVMR